MNTRYQTIPKTTNNGVIASLSRPGIPLPDRAAERIFTARRLARPTAVILTPWTDSATNADPNRPQIADDYTIPYNNSFFIAEHTTYSASRGYTLDLETVYNLIARNQGDPSKP
jgi:hypothetical protein